jgi:membrane protease YdiL (CAAX protease family)
VVIGCTLVALPFQMFGGERSPIFYLLSTVAIFVTTVIFTSIHWRPLSAQLKRSGFGHWEAWAGIASLIPLLLLNYTYHMLVRKFSPFGGSNITDDIPLPIGILIFCVFPAVTEEIAFRGLVQYWLEVALTPTKALFLGSAMFAGLHFSVLSFPYLFLVGAALALVRRRTGSLYPGMAMHFLHNLVVITCFGF